MFANPRHTQSLPEQIAGQSPFKATKLNYSRSFLRLASCALGAVTSDEYQTMSLAGRPKKTAVKLLVGFAVEYNAISVRNRSFLEFQLKSSNRTNSNPKLDYTIHSKSKAGYSQIIANSGYSGIDPKTAQRKPKRRKHPT